MIGLRAKMSSTALFGAATITLVAALHSSSALAQALNCPDLYNRLMGLYRTAPQSAEYSQIAGTYNASCRGAVSPSNSGVGTTSAMGPTNLPMRGAPTNTVPTESRAIVRGGTGAGHK